MFRDEDREEVQAEEDGWCFEGLCVISGPGVQARSFSPPCLSLCTGQLCAKRCLSLELRDMATLALIHTRNNTHTHTHTGPQVLLLRALIHSLQVYTQAQLYTRTQMYMHKYTPIHKRL